MFLIKKKLNINFFHDFIDLNIEQLYLIGISFVSRKNAWNKVLSFYFYGTISYINIVNLSFSLLYLRKFIFFMTDVYYNGGRILVIDEDCINKKLLKNYFKCFVYINYVNDKWMGGTLTNYLTIRTGLIKNIKYYTTLILLSKKSGCKIKNKIFNDLFYFKSYLRSMNTFKKFPSFAFVFTNTENNQFWTNKEIYSLKLPCFGGYNENYNHLDYIIPGNCVSFYSNNFYCSLIFNSFLEGFFKFSYSNNFIFIIGKLLKFFTYRELKFFFFFKKSMLNIFFFKYLDLKKKYLKNYFCFFFKSKYLKKKFKIN
uniref:Ribosomal protein S2 n=1 Tax=Paravannella minima TaxID=1443144 RepID=A0A411K7L8_9EUKA|nr:ribosomal protein S2 [Paravannella minima]QBC73415.1 ribosomal protein S2 [Paravannella minima]